jgi:hypothetical protein
MAWQKINVPNTPPVELTVRLNTPSYIPSIHNDRSEPYRAASDRRGQSGAVHTAILVAPTIPNDHGPQEEKSLWPLAPDEA